MRHPMATRSPLQRQGNVAIQVKTNPTGYYVVLTRQQPHGRHTGQALAH